MKNIHQKLGAMLCALTLLLGGCAQKTPQDSTPDTESAQYLATISALEQALEKEREKHTQSELAYQAQIAELQAKVDQLDKKEEEPKGEYVEFRYRVENGGAVITGYRGNCALLTVPDTLDGYPVIAIGERAFQGADFTAVVLPNGLVSIGWFAFLECAALINVTLPSSVTSIGYAVFDGCGDLTLYCPQDSYAARYAQSYGIGLITT